MNPAGLVLAARDGVSVHRRRSLLAVLSIVVGIASVTLVVAIGDLARSAALQAVERQAGRPATFVSALDVPASTGLDRLVVAEQLAAAVGRAGVAARVLQSEGRIASGRSQPRAQLIATDPSLGAIRRFELLAGRWLEARDADTLGLILVANRALADELGIPTVPGEAAGLPRPVVVDLGRPVGGLVVGVVDDGGRNSTAYVPIPAFMAWTTSPAGPLLFFVWLPGSPKENLDVRQRLDDLADRLGTHLELQRLDDPEAVNRLVGVLQLALGAIAGLSLVTGGLGVVNLALAVVDERSREFAIRRAFGATRREVFLIVLLESLLVVGAGGVLGVVAAVLGASGLALLIGPAIGVYEPPGPPFGAALLGLAITVVLGILVGFAPARRATSRSVVRAIRD